MHLRQTLIIAPILLLAGCGNRDVEPDHGKVSAYRHVILKQVPTDAEVQELTTELPKCGLDVVPKTAAFLDAANADSRATLVCTLESSTGQYLSEKTLTLEDYISGQAVFRKTKGASTAKEDEILASLLNMLDRARRGDAVGANSDDLDEKRRQLRGDNRPATSGTPWAQGGR